MAAWIFAVFDDSICWHDATFWYFIGTADRLHDITSPLHSTLLTPTLIISTLCVSVPTCFFIMTSRSSVQELVHPTNVSPVSFLASVGMEAAIPPEDRKRGRRRGTKSTPCDGLACEVCGRSFRHLSNLREHQRIHSTKFKFNCPVVSCNRQFHWRSSLHAHLRSHQAKLQSSKQHPPQCVELRTK